jgi:DNA recombination protein RmuC
MFEAALLGLLIVNLVAVLWLLLRPRGDAARREEAMALREQLRGDAQQLDRGLREELHGSARDTRQELAQSLSLFQQGLLTQQGDVARTQNEQIDSFRAQLAAMQQMVGQSLQGATQALAQQSQATQEGLSAALLRVREAQDSALKRFSDAFAEQLRGVAAGSERALETMRLTIEQRLQAIQADNEKKLEQMRATVDEKLQATLEQRLSESFRQVAERLEQVHRGLGEMQKLASDVGSLNRVLTNVKSRGTFGEVQLAGLLEQVFTPEQYGVNVETVPGSGARVEFAIKMPGRKDGGAPLWLPIDSKFPRDDYEKLLDAQDRADKEGVELYGMRLERQLRDEAKTIRTKYVQPPHTAEFAILFVPTEGLYAEALRRAGLMEALLRDHRVMLAGPTTLLATLTSLQMGFRTLALEQRSTEVWEVLGAVKTEFGKFGEYLARVRGQVATVAKSLEAADTRTRQMQRALRSVESLPEARAQELLPPAEADADADLPVEGGQGG